MMTKEKMIQMKTPKKEDLELLTNLESPFSPALSQPVELEFAGGMSVLDPKTGEGYHVHFLKDPFGNTIPIKVEVNPNKPFFGDPILEATNNLKDVDKVKFEFDPIENKIEIEPKNKVTSSANALSSIPTEGFKDNADSTSKNPNEEKPTSPHITSLKDSKSIPEPSLGGKSSEHIDVHDPEGPHTSSGSEPVVVKLDPTPMISILEPNFKQLGENQRVIYQGVQQNISLTKKGFETTWENQKVITENQRKILIALGTISTTIGATMSVIQQQINTLTMIMLGFGILTLVLFGLLMYMQYKRDKEFKLLMAYLINRR